MLEVSLPGVFAYVENKICSNVVGVVILILSELPFLCSISKVSDFFIIIIFFSDLCIFQNKRHTGCLKK